MARRLAFWILAVTLLALTPFRSPAPLVYIPGEGWYYETYGEKQKAAGHYQHVIRMHEHIHPLAQAMWRSATN